MSITKAHIESMFLSVAFCCALGSPLVPFAINDSYFRLYPLSIGIGVACMVCLLSTLFPSKKTFHFCLPDGLITVGIFYYLLRYDYTLQPANWKIIYAILLGLLWFAARIAFSLQPKVKDMLIPCIAIIGSILALWGIMQLYGWAAPGHYLFHITGPFFNPGPYSGYLALLLPICLFGFLKSRDWTKGLYTISLILTICILPAAMSRSAWVAVAISLLWVTVMYKGGWQSYRMQIQKKTFLIGGVTVIACLVLFTIGVYLFHMKADSARGRLLIWKNTCHAISEQPLLGHGVGSFPAAYGKAQATYFASGKATPAEEHVAGYAEYAFNDFLQLTLEGGIILIVLVLGTGFWIFRQGVRQAEYGYCGALLAFACFALFSYPLQILPFGVAITMLSAACIPPTESKRHCLLLPYTPVLALLLCIGSGAVIWKLRKLPQVYEWWQGTDVLYLQSFYDEAVKDYREIYPHLKGHPVYLRNYARALYAQGDTLAACRMLDREKLVSCNADIWNEQGKYYQSAGRYEEAEQCFRYSLNLAPERIYPYYLLSKLYTEKNFFHKEKALEAANIVLNKPPKVHTKAIDEMRIEILPLYNQLSSN